jgi:hypothetical protein
MSEEFAVGDRVEYEDAYTREIKYGLITHMQGADAVIRTITKQEAGPNPNELPKTRMGCAFERSIDDTPMRRLHQQPLNRLAVHAMDPNPPGPGHFSAWICPASNKQVYDAGF